MPIINGTSGNDTYIVGDGQDWTIYGLGGDDHITGGVGNDTLDGGSGNDVLSGGGGHDVLTGGTGSDVFIDSALNLNGDEITDFQPGDRIQVTDVAYNSADLIISGHTLYYGSGYSVTIDNLGPGRFVLRTLGNTGFEIRLQEPAHSDFNGDGISDILWRNSSGYLTEWLGKTDGSGGFVNNSSIAGNGSADTNWQVTGTGDFNGDGLVDLLWRNTTSGYITEWLGTANGSFTSNQAIAGNGSADNSWKVVGTGDFNGDGISDILWRNTASGYVTQWLGTSTGAFTSNQANAGNGSADNSWQVSGTGDFNGDGIDDILWRNTASGYITEWLGTSTGGFTSNQANAGNGSADNSWQIVGTGDFNGDAMADILWRNSASGYLTEWLGTSTGGFTSNQANAGNGSADNSWQVVSIGDFNHDTIDDLLWRNTASGYTTEWVGTGSGAFVSNQAAAGTGAADTTWHVQDPFF